MGTVIRFPEVKRAAFTPAAAALAQMGAGSILILPVVRIERHDEESADTPAPSSGRPGSGGRRRRS